MKRLEKIRQRLLQKLNPPELQISDDSDKHVGHPGARDGRGHYSVRVVSEQFQGKSRVERHRMVFSIVGTLMHTDIHALRIEALTPDEFESNRTIH